MKSPYGGVVSSVLMSWKRLHEDSPGSPMRRNWIQRPIPIVELPIHPTEHDSIWFSVLWSTFTDPWGCTKCDTWYGFVVELVTFHRGLFAPNVRIHSMIHTLTRIHDMIEICWRRITLIHVQRNSHDWQMPSIHWWLDWWPLHDGLILRMKLMKSYEITQA